VSHGHLSEPFDELRYTEWTLAPERDRNGRPFIPVREVQCQVCGQRSGSQVGQQTTDTWAMRHAGPTRHRGYLEVTTAALTARPAPTNPLYDDTQETPS
jgi:hypothetical protein